MAGRTPALQQNWRSSEKITTFYGKNTIFKEHPVCKAQLISPRCLTGQDSKKNLKLCRGIMKCGRMWVLSNQNKHTRKKTYPIYKKNCGWGLCGIYIPLHFPPLHSHLLISPSLSCQSHGSYQGVRGPKLPFCQCELWLFSEE